MKLLPFGLYRVSGPSMQPTYSPGDTLVGWRWFRPRAGQVVVVVKDRPLIKRIAGLSSASADLRGDNPRHSTDSRHFGPVPLTELEAVIIAKL